MGIITIHAYRRHKNIYYFVDLLGKFYFYLVSQDWLGLRVSKYHGLMVVQQCNIFLTLRIILRFVCSNKNFSYVNLLQFYSSWFTHIMWFLVWVLHFVLRQISKLRFGPRKKKPFSECLLVQYDNIWDKTNYSKERTAWQGKNWKELKKSKAIKIVLFETY